MEKVEIKGEQPNEVKTEEINVEYSDFILYSYWRASCPWRVRLALNLKEIPHKIQPINLLKKEHQSEDYLKINKFGRLPCLEFTETKFKNKEKIGSTKRYIAESTAIIDFLEEVFPNKFPLLPQGKDQLLDKIKIKSLAYHVACNIHPLQNLNVLNKVESQGQDKIEWAKFFIKSGLTSLEQELKETKGKYCYGNEITLADIYLYPQLYFFKRNNVSLEEFPIISEIQKNLKEHPAFIKAEPENQIDAVI